MYYGRKSVVETIFGTREWSSEYGMEKKTVMDGDRVDDKSHKMG